MSATVRTVLVTGATSGIGLETARRFAAQDVRLLLHARDAGSGEQAVETLVKGGADPLRLHVLTADFSRLSEVHALAGLVARDHPRLDVLVNNAGVAGPVSRVLTADGHEFTFQVNYLAPYLLTRLLWEPLTSTPGSRVVNVSSLLHRSGHIHWGDLGYAGRYSPVAAYAQSKLALTLFTKGLAEYGQSGPEAVAVHPGTVKTPVMQMYGRTGAPVGEAAAVVVHLASPGTVLDNGAFYDRLSPARSAPLVQDRKAVGRLWKLTARLTGLG